jgi:hypothetical protein
MRFPAAARFTMLGLCLWLSLEMARAGEPVSLFNGKDLTGWKTAGRRAGAWQVGTAAVAADRPGKLEVRTPGTELVGTGDCPNLVSEASFGDCLLELEFMIPKNSNSGVKLMRIYEIQILDSHGKPTAGKSDCGAIYLERAPTVNACKPPGEWQTLSIEFRAPRFDADGKKVSDARFVKVVMNGETIHADVAIPHGTNVGPNVKEQARGEVLLQGDHGPVAFRNIRITPRDEPR